jgi:hypothetical protein
MVAMTPLSLIRFLLSPWRHPRASPPPESLLDETCRRAAELAAVDPAQAIPDGGPLERFVRGRHAARGEELGERAAERMAVLQGAVAAEKGDTVAARAIAARARDEWERERAELEAAVHRVVAAEAAVARAQEKRDELSPREKGYLGCVMKWVLVIAVALALAPLVFLSMEFMDDLYLQILVTAAATAGIFAAEHALGYALAHAAQHVPRRTGIAALIAAGVAVAALIAAAEYYAGDLRNKAGQAAQETFDPTAVLQGQGTGLTSFIEMTWTIPLGIGATLAGSLVVAFYALGHRGREVAARLEEAGGELEQARAEHREAVRRTGHLRAAYDAAEAATDGVAGRARRAEAELAGADVAARHARAAAEGHRDGALGAAEMAYHAARARRAEVDRLREAAEAREAASAEREQERRRDHLEREDARRSRREARAAERRERRRARVAERRERREAAYARASGGLRAVAGRTPDAVRFGGPATTAGLLVLGLGGPATLAVGAAIAGLTAARATADVLRRRTTARPLPAHDAPIQAEISTNGTRKDPV